MKTLILLFSVLFTTMSFAQVPSYLPANGLVGWWPFNGNANDESGNGNNGTNNGATLTTDRNGVANQAYMFQTNDITINNNFYNNGWQDYSISFWFNTSIISQQSQNFFNTSPHDGEGFGWNHANAPNKISHWKNEDLNGHAWNIFSANPLNYNNVQADNWIFLTIVKTDLVYNYYVNGQLDKVSIATLSALNQFTGMRFGSISSAEFFNGKLDDIGIWNRALTDCEIQNLYTSTNPSNTTSQTACNSYTWNGQTYTQSGVYTDTTNCVTESLNLTITPSSTNTTTAAACDSYAWNGTTYTSSGVYTGNTANCVTESLNLTITPSSTNTTTATACDSYNWNGTSYSASGTYTGTTSNCVTESLNLTITPSSTNTTTASACNNYTWNGQAYAQSGVYTGPTANCVTESLNLTITPSSTNTTTASACDSYTWNGQTYTASGVYTGTTSNCVTESLNLTITQTFSDTTIVIACDSYTWNGTTYTESGTYTGITENCITQSLKLTINPSTSSSISQTALDSYTWLVNNQTYTTTGAYTAVIPNASGCDSTITLNLTMSFTGINDLSTSKLSVYPNPTNGDFTITGLELVGTVSSLSLTDMNGKVVKVLDTKATKFSMGSIKPGVYFLNILSGNKEEVLKIVKE